MRIWLEMFGMIAAIIFISIWIHEAAGRYSCGNYEDLTGTPTLWVFADHCYVNHNGAWARWDEYTARVTASDAVSGAKKP